MTVRRRDGGDGSIPPPHGRLGTPPPPSSRPLVATHGGRRIRVPTGPPVFRKCFGWETGEGPAARVRLEIGSRNEVLIGCGVSGGVGAGVNLSTEAADDVQSADVGLQLGLSGTQTVGEEVEFYYREVRWEASLVD